MTLSVKSLARRRRDGAGALFEGVTFDLPAGVTTVLVGASGAGKSTLLRCLAGLEAPDAGQILVDGRPIAPPADGRVGLVFQSAELFPHLTVLENCALAPRLVRGWSRVESEVRARLLLGLFGLDSRVDAHPTRLSGGERQRVAIVRAMLLEPRVLLFDELTSALDADAKAGVLSMMREIAARGVAQLVVTHDLEAAGAIADRIVRLEGGRLVELLPDDGNESAQAV